MQSSLPSALEIEANKNKLDLRPNLAYELGIIPNDDGWTDFKAESFGSAVELSSFETELGICAESLRYYLMARLCQSELIAIRKN